MDPPRTDAPAEREEVARGIRWAVLHFAMVCFLAACATLVDASLTLFRLPGDRVTLPATAAVGTWIGSNPLAGVLVMIAVFQVVPTLVLRAGRDNGDRFERLTMYFIVLELLVALTIVLAVVATAIAAAGGYEAST